MNEGIAHAFSPVSLTIHKSDILGRWEKSPQEHIILKCFALMYVYVTHFRTKRDKEKDARARARLIGEKRSIEFLLEGSNILNQKFVSSYRGTVLPATTLHLWSIQ